MPNRPSIRRRFIPQEGSQEFSKLVKNPNLFSLGAIKNQFQMALGIALVEILSRQSIYEVYLGERATSEWSENDNVTATFEHFGTKLKK